MWYEMWEEEEGEEGLVNHSIYIASAHVMKDPKPPFLHLHILF